MNTHSCPHPRVCLSRWAALVIAAACLLPASAFGQIRTWDGGAVTSGTGVWHTATNWTDDTLPISTGTAVFASGYAGALITDDILPPYTTTFPSVSVGLIRFTTGAASYRFQNNAFVFANGGGITVDSGVTTDQFFVGGVTISPGLRLAQNSTGTIRNDGTGLLALDVGFTSIPVFGGGGSSGLVFDGSGTTRIGAIRDRDTNISTAVVKNGSGVLTITAGATSAPTSTVTGWYRGGTTLNAGTLNVNDAYALGGGGLTITGGTLGNTSGTAVTLLTNNTQTWSGDFGFAGTSNLNLGTGPVSLGSATRTVTVSANTLTVGGGISGSGGLTKTGAGTLTLSASNSYAGTTTVNQGTLILGSAGSFASSTTIRVGNAGSSGAVLDLTSKTSGFTFGSGQTVGGIGTLNIGAGRTVTSSGIWAPGNSIGSNAVTGNLALSGTSKFELGTPGTSTTVPGLSDFTAVSGTLTLGGNLQLINNAGADGNGSLAGGIYRLFTYGNAVSGSFASVTTNPSATTVTGLGDISYGGPGTAAGQGVFLTVYDRAVASFASGTVPSTSLTLDFFTVNEGDTVSPLNFSLYNLLQTAGFTADLALIDIAASNPSGPFSTNLSLFNSLASGTFNSWQASVNTATQGTFTNTWTLQFKSANGGTVYSGDTTQTLTLTAQVIVVPEPGALALAGIGIAAAAYAFRSRSPSRRRAG